MAQKVFKTGNSLAVTLPAGFASSVGIRAGDRVKVAQNPEKSRLTYQFSATTQLPLDSVFFARRRRGK
ncbi:MAG: AbrB/MazE/SpoVT family DNA-binding domain-containing protein [Candidatus Blackburnbacteria bacterium]|nr:AbrB/MazE/SpoVT family DNA-binding domain-containing protein [Candidatus Blackburnbacteria bacterium]